MCPAPAHPHIENTSALTRPAASARALGDRMPAEWELQDAVWVAPPHNAETWPGCLDKAHRQFDDFLSKLRRVTDVRDACALAGTDDSWMRDFGPVYVIRDDEPAVALHDFHFDGWGGKYEVRAADDVVPQVIAQRPAPTWPPGPAGTVRCSIRWTSLLSSRNTSPTRASTWSVTTAGTRTRAGGCGSGLIVKAPRKPMPPRRRLTTRRPAIARPGAGSKKGAGVVPMVCSVLRRFGFMC